MVLCVESALLDCPQGAGAKVLLGLNVLPQLLCLLPHWVVFQSWLHALPSALVSVVPQVLIHSPPISTLLSIPEAVLGGLCPLALPALSLAAGLSC